VRKEVVRTLLNWVGAAIGGLRHETVEVAERKFLDRADGVISAAQARKRWICAGRSKRSTTRAICRAAQRFEA